jgi:hypothetical protein
MALLSPKKLAVVIVRWLLDTLENGNLPVASEGFRAHSDQDGGRLWQATKSKDASPSIYDSESNNTSASQQQVVVANGAIGRRSDRWENAAGE